MAEALMQDQALLEASHKDMANAIRALAMDAVQKADSGHPGMPMGMADAASVLFTRFLKFDPADPAWPDRDRFMLSAGHGSMLLYALLHLSGYEKMTLEELRRFRQWGSRTPGHPEYDLEAGVETTSGPLGQGLANAVGMALAERLLQARFGAELVDHHTYVIAGDGCLMEGISHEAASFAGHLRLAKLIVLFDDNRISIDGATSLTVSDEVCQRFAAYGWASERVDGHDPEAVAAALARARASDRPSLIACRTTIAFGAPKKAGTAAAHGAPLGPEEVAGARKQLGWAYPPFEIPAAVLAAWRKAGARGAPLRAAWRERLARQEPERGGEFERRVAGELPEGWPAQLRAHKRTLSGEPKALATRVASHNALAVLTAAIPELVGGSADLTGSNGTRPDNLKDIAPGDFSGRYIRYGVREHAMAAVMTGLALHRGVVPYGGSFLIFTDYCRPAIRLAVLMKQRVIYVMTHDSIGLGEDGPTHQPIEHLPSLRAIPNLWVLRPADAVETAECWELALARRDGPSVIVLTRQSVPLLRTVHTEENLCAQGAYEIAPATGAARATILASGSEVAIALEARRALEGAGSPTRVVSMPCWALFERRAGEERARTLGPRTLRIAIEAASPFGWERYVGENGAVIGLNRFGASAPYATLYKELGITAEAVVAAVKERL